jgi:hypothetical protein
MEKPGPFFCSASPQRAPSPGGQPRRYCAWSAARRTAAAARRTAAAVGEAFDARDQLTLVAFDSQAELLLGARAMDADGRSAAVKAISRLADQGGTNLFESPRRHEPLCLRMAAVFTISTATIALRTRFTTRWIALAG